MDDDIYYHKYLKYKLKYINLLKFLNKKKTYIDENNLNDKYDKMYDKDISIKPSNVGDSLRTVESSNRSTNDVDVGVNIDIEIEKKIKKFFNLENKLKNNIYTIIAYLYYKEKENKTENEDILYNSIKQDALDIISTLNHKEKQIINDINSMEIIKLYSYSCNKVINENISIIKNKSCINEDDVNKLYINSEITDKLLKCKTNDFLIDNLDNYLNLKSCD